MVRARLAICATLAVALAAASPGVAAPQATLKLLKTQPVEVRGTGFEPREAVRVTVRAGHDVTRAAASADRSGRFVATVAGAMVPRCAALVITATGSNGTRAVLRRFPRCAVRGG